MLSRSPHSPKKIGPFRIIDRVGEGGMGVVYKGLSRDGTAVAVKLVKEEYAGVPEFRARFAREIELMSRVSSGNVVPIVAADAEAERPWLAMPFVSGPTLADYVRNHGVLSGEQLLIVAISVAEALTAIHRAEVVHRDLKPSNVILAESGPKVVDFGIARTVEGTTITRTSVMVGTPGWLSPEQYEGKEATSASDVFSWASLVVFAATGSGPFGQGTADSVAFRAVRDKPDLEPFIKVADSSLHKPVTEALSKEPTARPAAYEVVSTLIRGSGDTGDPVLAATRIIRDSWPRTGITSSPHLSPKGDEQSKFAPVSPWKPALLGALAGSVLTAAAFGAVLVGLDDDGTTTRKGGSTIEATGAPLSMESANAQEGGHPERATTSQERKSAGKGSINVVDGVTSRVKDVFLAKTMTDTSGKKHHVPGQHFLVLRIESKNVGSEPAYPGFPINQVRTSDGKTYIPSTDSFPHMVSFANGDKMALNPEESGMNTTSFMLPDKATPVSVFFATPKGEKEYSLPSKLRTVDNWKA